MIGGMEDERYRAEREPRNCLERAQKLRDTDSPISRAKNVFLIVIHRFIPIASDTSHSTLLSPLQVWFLAPVLTTPSLDSVLMDMSSFVTRTED